MANKNEKKPQYSMFLAKGKMKVKTRENFLFTTVRTGYY